MKRLILTMHALFCISSSIDAMFTTKSDPYRLKQMLTQDQVNQRLDLLKNPTQIDENDLAEIATEEKFAAKSAKWTAEDLFEPMRNFRLQNEIAWYQSIAGLGSNYFVKKIDLNKIDEKKITPEQKLPYFQQHYGQAPQSDQNKPDQIRWEEAQKFYNKQTPSEISQEILSHHADLNTAIIDQIQAKNKLGQLIPQLRKAKSQAACTILGATTVVTIGAYLWLKNNK